jgi:protein-tyrosine phosphatase
MPEVLYKIECDLYSGKLAVSPRPRGNDWLEDDLGRWKMLGITQVVSLLEPDEEVQLGLENEHAECERIGLRFHSFPIPDCGVPADTEAFADLVHQMQVDLEQGQRIVIHCRQGIGRSGLLAACVLMSFEMPMKDALERITLARGVPVPETEQQRLWLVQYLQLPLREPAF